MWRGLFAATLFAVVFVTSGTRLWTDHHVEDWRGASAVLREIRQREPGVTILAVSSFTESRHLPMPVDAAQKRWLLAPQFAYSIPGPLDYLPLEIRPVNEIEVRKAMNKAAGQDHFPVLPPPSAPLAQVTFGRFLEDYRHTVLHSNPLIVRFERRVAR